MANSILKSFGVNAQRRLIRCKLSHHDTRDLTFAPGWLVPIYCKDVIPSDVWNMKEVDVQVKQVIASLKPTFGDVYLSMYYFFVPYRILWKKWPDIFGKGQPSEWSTPVETVLPRCKFNAGVTGNTVNLKPTTGGGYDGVVNTCVVASTQNPPEIVSVKGNLADYLGFALTVLGHGSDVVHQINWLHFAAYEKIWTESFRDENVQNSDPDVEKCFEYSGSGNLDVRFSLHYANKLHDVYTKCLPSPQKGLPVHVALGDTAPIILANDAGATFSIGQDQKFEIAASQAATVGNVTGTYANATSGLGTYASVASIYADLKNAVGATVNEVRFDFAMQNMKERDARGGTRYNEILLSAFEAYNGDLAMQRPEFLGGDTIPLNMTTVPSTGDNNPGKLGGMSNTNFSSRPFVKTFGEFGVLMGVMCVRPRNMYCQGIPKFASKYRRYHFYDPALQTIGDQPVYTKEIYSLAAEDDVFGFQEAWYEYRMDENIVCADMRGGTTDMDAWSYVQKFSSQPYLNSQFKEQHGDAITKTLDGYNIAYPEYVYACHIDFKHEVTSPMRPNSIPGLIDHVI